MGAGGAAHAGDLQGRDDAIEDRVGKEVPRPKMEGGVQGRRVGRDTVEVVFRGG